MRIFKWALISSGLIFATSCGSNSTKETDTTVTGDTVMSSPVDTGSTSTNYSNTTSNTASVTVPDQLRTSFQTKYPNVQNPTWSRYQQGDNIEWDWSGWPSMDTSDYAVRFNMDNTEHWAWYDSKTNEWVGTVSSVSDYKSLPAEVNKTIESQYPGYTIVSVDKENDKNRTAYEVELTKGEDKVKALISEAGKVMKKKSLTDGVKTKDKM